MNTFSRRQFLIAIGILCFSCGLALGHAYPDHSQPKVGSEVAVSPTDVRIWFTDEIQEPLSGMQVLNADGKQVDKKDFHLDSQDKTLGIVSLPPLPAGKYKVVWHATMLDTHKTQGDFTFTVKASAASPPATGTAPATGRATSRPRP